MKKNSWVNGLDSLRFFLALIVVLSHLPNPFAIFLKGLDNNILKTIGYIITPLFCGVGAVIAFFIISGFVIHYPNKNKEIAYFNFLSRRWIRLLIPMIIASFVASRFNLFFALPLWSLYCELIYYALYPLLVKVKVSWRTKFWISFALSIIVILVFCKNDILSLIHQQNIHFSGGYWQLGTSLTWLVGLPCWLLGVLLAEDIDNQNYPVSVSKIFTWRISLFILGMIIQIIRFKFFVSWVLSMNLLAFILVLWIKDEIVYYRTHKPVSFFEFLGKFSYSLYLVHELVIAAILYFIPINVFSYIPVVVIAIAASYVVFLIIEKPSHMLAQKIRIGAPK